MVEGVTMSLRCADCAKETGTRPTRKGKARLPRAWKRQGEAVYCHECWGKRYKLRAITFPVAEPLEGGTRDEMWQALRGCWAEATSLANWANHELALADNPRLPGQEQLGRMPKVYLYGLASERYPGWGAWAGCYAAAQSLLHAVEQKYGKKRLDVVWRSAAVHPTARYPQPYPVHNANWQPLYHETTGEDGQVLRVPAVRVVFGGRRWLLRLRGGQEMRRQLRSFGQLVRGEAIQGELALYPQRASNGAHRMVGEDRKAGGGPTVKNRLMCKLVAWLPRDVREKARTGTLSVRTARNCLWVATHPGREEPWLLHAHYLRGLQRSHEKRIEALADDQKAERRRPRRERQNYQGFLDKLTYRYKRRMRSALEHAASMLVNYADRAGVRTIRYDDADGRYCPGLAWTWLRQLVEAQALDLGLTFEHASGKVAETHGYNEDGATADQDSP